MRLVAAGKEPFSPSMPCVEWQRREVAGKGMAREKLEHEGAQVAWLECRSRAQIAVRAQTSTPTSTLRQSRRRRPFVNTCDARVLAGRQFKSHGCRQGSCCCCCCRGGGQTCGSWPQAKSHSAHNQAVLQALSRGGGRGLGRSANASSTRQRLKLVSAQMMIKLSRKVAAKLHRIGTSVCCPERA